MVNEPKQIERRPEADQLILDTRARHCPKCKKTPLAHFRRTGWRCFLCDKDSDFDPAIRAGKVHAIMIERRIFPVPVELGWTAWVIVKGNKAFTTTPTGTFASLVGACARNAEQAAAYPPPAPDPFTAIEDAEAWYQAHIEPHHPGQPNSSSAT